MSVGPKRIRLKCHFQNDIRVVRLTDDTSFETLVARLNEDYGFVVTLKYEDSDGDLIQLDTQNDLDELLEETSTHSVKVFIAEAAVASPQQAAAAILKSSPAGGSGSGGAARSGGSSGRNGGCSGGRSGSGSPHGSLRGKVRKGLPPKALEGKKTDIIDQALSTLSRRGSNGLHQRGPSGQMVLQTPWRWQRGEILGQGAFGTVYLGLNLNSGELMAVKQLDSNEVTKKELMSLEHEIAMMRNLDHENITRYLGTERTEDKLSIFLEYVPGGSIHSLLGRFGRFEEMVTRTYTRQLLLGLEYLHRNGIAHRDIKGANVLVANDGTVKLADFGASKSVGHKSLTATGIKGTPMWMAPEVIKQQQTVTGWKKADIWSVGCTVIEMVTGKPPWSQYSNPVTAMYHIACENEIPTIPDMISAQGRAFLLNALKRDPDVRPDATSLLLNPFVAFVEQWHQRSKETDYQDRPNTSGGLNDERDVRSRQRGRGSSRREPRWNIRETHSRQSSKAAGGGGGAGGGGAAAGSGSILGGSVMNSTNTLQASYQPDVSIDFSESVTDGELAAFVASAATSAATAASFPFERSRALELEGVDRKSGGGGGGAGGPASPNDGGRAGGEGREGWDQPDGLLTDGSYESRSPLARTADEHSASMEESMEFDDSYDVDDEFLASPTHGPSPRVGPGALGGVGARHHHAHHHHPHAHHPRMGGGGLDLEESHDSIDSALQSSADEVRLGMAAARTSDAALRAPPQVGSGGGGDGGGEQRRGDSGVKLSPVYRSRTAPMDVLEDYSPGRGGPVAAVLPPSAAHMAPVRAGTTQPQRIRDPMLRQATEGAAHQRAQSSAGIHRPSKNAVGGRNYSNRSARRNVYDDGRGGGRHGGGGSERQMSPVSLDFISKHQQLSQSDHFHAREIISSRGSSGGSSGSGSLGSGSGSVASHHAMETYAALGSAAKNKKVQPGSKGDAQQQQARASFGKESRFSLMVGGNATGIRVKNRRANEIRRATFYD